MVMNYLHAKVQCQWSVGSEDRVETNGQTYRQTDGRKEGQTDFTEGGDCITFLANAVLQSVKIADIV